LIQDMRLVPGWTVIDGYATLWKALEALPWATMDQGLPGQ
jgi:hypothetical protein